MRELDSSSPGPARPPADPPRRNLSVQHPVAVLAATFALVLLGYNLVFLALRGRDLMRSSDFTHYYASAWLVRNGFDVYRTEFGSTPLVHQLTFHPQIPRATNPPTLVVLTAPLALMGPGAAWLTFFLFIALSGAGCLVVMYRELWRGWEADGRAVAVMLFTSASWLAGALFYCQIQPLILLLVLCGWMLLRRAPSFCGGFLWGMAAAIKLYAWPLFFFLLFRRQWRPVAGAMAGAGIGLGVPAAVLGPRIYADFLSCVPAILNHWSAESAFNVSLGGTVNTMSVLLLGLQPFSSPLLRGLIGTALPALAMVWLAALLAGKTRSRAAFDAGAAIVSSLSFLSGLVAWPNYLIAASFPLSVGWNYSRRRAVDAAVLLGIWVALQTKPDGGSFLTPLLGTNVILPPPAAVVIILALFVWFRRDADPAAAE